MYASLNNFLLMNHWLPQIFICTYRVLGSPEKHSSSRYSKSVMRAKFSEQLLEKDFYSKGGIWDGSLKTKGILGGGMTEAWWTATSSLSEVWSAGKRRWKLVGATFPQQLLTTYYVPSIWTLSSEQNLLKLLFSWSLHSSGKIHKK